MLDNFLTPYWLAASPMQDTFWRLGAKSKQIILHLCFHFLTYANSNPSSGLDHGILMNTSTVISKCPQHGTQERGCNIIIALNQLQEPLDCRQLPYSAIKIVMIPLWFCFSAIILVMNKCSWKHSILQTGVETECRLWCKKALESYEKIHFAYTVGLFRGFNYEKELQVKFIL